MTKPFFNSYAILISNFYQFLAKIDHNEIDWKEEKLKKRRILFFCISEKSGGVSFAIEHASNL